MRKLFLLVLLAIIAVAVAWFTGGEKPTLGSGPCGREDEGMPLAQARRWLGKFEFVEWTPDNHLRHSRFTALRNDKKNHDVRRES